MSVAEQPVKDKVAFKRKALEIAKERQQALINDFKTRIQELRDSEMDMNEDQYDEEQRSHDASSDHLINRLADQVNFAVEEMDLLNKMKITDQLHQHVAFGSIVKTDQRTFFPSVSTEQFMVDGQEIFGISTKAPLFQLMRDKRVGQQFSYKDINYRIEEIY